MPRHDAAHNDGAVAGNLTRVFFITELAVRFNTFKLLNCSFFIGRDGVKRVFSGLGN